MAIYGYDPLNEFEPDEKLHRRRMALTINGILAGKQNVTAEVTLTASSGTTTLTDARLSAQSFVGFMPQTANAAAALGGLYVTARTNGSCTLNHANNAQNDKTFTVLIIG